MEKIKEMILDKIIGNTNKYTDHLLVVIKILESYDENEPVSREKILKVVNEQFDEWDMM